KLHLGGIGEIYAPPPPLGQAISVVQAYRPHLPIGVAHVEGSRGLVLGHGRREIALGDVIVEGDEVAVSYMVRTGEVLGERVILSTLDDGQRTLMPNLGWCPGEGADDHTSGGAWQDVGDRCPRWRIHWRPVIRPGQAHSGGAVEGLHVHRSRASAR